MHYGPTPQNDHSNSRGASRRPMLLVVEGVLDIAFLTRLAAVLRRTDPTIPDLDRHHADGSLVLLPIGGGDLTHWTHRLAPLDCPEFHLYDREAPPETERRQRAIDAINTRPNCLAVLTRKRSLENYLHPAAIAAVTGVNVVVNDNCDVSHAILAARMAKNPSTTCAWRDHRRQVLRLKRLLNTNAVEHMTTELLIERDPEQELITWLRRLGQALPRHSHLPQETS